MKYILISLALLTFVSCSNDSVKVINNSQRVSDLERRMALNEQLDSAQSAMIQANSDAISAEQSARQSADALLSAELQQEILDRAAGDSALQALINAEAQARQAGDNSLSSQLQIEIANRIAGDQANSAALAFAVFTQSLVNFGVQVNLNQINFKISQINSKINNLTNRVDNLEEDVDDLQNETNQLAIDIASLEASLSAEIDLVAAQAAATQAQLNQEGVKVFKCNSSSSTERILKINGKFYAAMNRVTTKQVQVITGSTSTTFINPKLCIRTGLWEEVQLPNSAGNCNPGYTSVGGNSITVPAYSTANQTVVDSVKIALDILSDGSYSTTDGVSACNFSISGSGSNSSNLVQVQ